jgi:hypothetical protein
MVLILLSLIVTVAMIVVAISMMRHRSSAGSLIRTGVGKEEFSVKGESAGQSVTPSPLKPFLIVVLPDGTTVSTIVAGQA